MHPSDLCLSKDGCAAGWRARTRGIALSPETEVTYEDVRGVHPPISRDYCMSNK